MFIMGLLRPFHFWFWIERFYILEVFLFNGIYCVHFIYLYISLWNGFSPLINNKQFCLVWPWLKQILFHQPITLCLSIYLQKVLIPRIMSSKIQIYIFNRNMESSQFYNALLKRFTFSSLRLLLSRLFNRLPINTGLPWKF